ncbi:MAG: Gfo/Idh/MocA family oxidoreductase [Verrucomicrobia bacterium]|nr:Gfo/Idh/MocA family oxidoreductase [Verrucomicrobiota bacterium]
MSREIRIGLVGCGGIGQHLISYLPKIPRARLTFVCDENADAAGQLARRLSVAACATPDELIGMPEVDAVIVGVPQFAHKEIVLKAAARRKHIFCEKPMALSLADCDEMLAAGARAGVKFMVGQVLRLIPIYAKARQWVQEEDMEQPLGIAVTRSCYSGDLFGKGWRLKRELTGGLLFEVNVHELDFMRHICGEAENVFAQSRKVFDHSVEYEDLWHVQIKFQSNAIGLLRASLSACVGEHHFTIQCPRGTITNNTPGGILSLKKREGAIRTVTEDEIQKMEDGFLWELRSWVEAVLDDKPMIVTARDGRQAVALAEAACESARTGRVIPVAA